MKRIGLLLIVALWSSSTGCQAIRTGYGGGGGADSYSMYSYQYDWWTGQRLPDTTHMLLYIECIDGNGSHHSGQSGDLFVARLDLANGGKVNVRYSAGSSAVSINGQDLSLSRGSVFLCYPEGEGGVKVRQTPVLADGIAATWGPEDRFILVDTIRELKDFLARCPGWGEIPADIGDL